MGRQGKCRTQGWLELIQVENIRYFGSMKGTVLWQGTRAIVNVFRHRSLFQYKKVKTRMTESKTRAGTTGC